MTTKAEAKPTHAGMSQFWAGATNHPAEFGKLISSQWPQLDDNALCRIGQSRHVLAEELIRVLSVSPEAAELQIVAWERLNTGG